MELSLFRRIKNAIKSNLNTKGESFFDGIGNKSFNSYEQPSNEPRVESHNSEDSSQTKLEKEYYANLELSFGAGFDEIKSSYKKLLKKYHPDKFYGNEKKLALAQEVVKKLNMAYNYFEEKYNK